jgi:ribosomal protein S18 acetylase RimI-like enzyme
MELDKFEIKAASIEDIPAIVELAGIIWPVCYNGIISREQIDYMLAKMYDKATLSREMQEKGVHYNLLVNGERICGFSAWGPETDKEAKLHKLYLHQDFHHQGLGSKLLQHAFKEVEDAGFTVLILNVNKKNTSAITAYQRNGFEIRKSVCNDFGDGFFMDDYVMAKKIKV